MVLKPSMVISGKDAAQRADVATVAAQTVRCLLDTVPRDVPGIAFLSGGQSDEDSAAHLDAMHRLEETLPWRLTFSYGRALQHAAMQAWGGKPEHVESAQTVGMHRARMNGLASMGQYSPELEKQAA
jgi:fructose-bisphosphate aldolase class I